VCILALKLLLCTRLKSSVVTLFEGDEFFIRGTHSLEIPLKKKERQKKKSKGKSEIPGQVWNDKEKTK